MDEDGFRCHMKATALRSRLQGQTFIYLFIYLFIYIFIYINNIILPPYFVN